MQPYAGEAAIQSRLSRQPIGSRTHVGSQYAGVADSTWDSGVPEGKACWRRESGPRPIASKADILTLRKFREILHQKQIAAMHPSKRWYVKARYMESRASCMSKKIEAFFSSKTSGKFFGPAKVCGPKFPEISWTEIWMKKYRCGTFSTNTYVVARFWS